MAIKSFRDLTVWQKSMDLAAEVYILGKLLPKEETYALADQMRRAAASIPSNIAEGQARASKKEFLQFLSIASGSKAELETQLLLCVKIGYIAQGQIARATDLIQEVGKMLSSLKTKLTTAN